MVKDSENINPAEDMKYEISLLDYGGETNKDVVHKINEDRSGIYLESFVLGGLRLRVIDTISYKPWNFGNVHKGSGQVGVYKLEDDAGKIYFAMIKDYIAHEGDWRIMLTNIRDSERALKIWLSTNTTYGTTLAEYVFGLDKKK